MRKYGFSTFLAGALALVPTVTSAHTGIGDTTGFFHGFQHPVSGLDHLLAMILVGILAWQVGGRAVIAVPASFVLLMAVGSGLGVAKMPVPFVEAGIALSIIAFGAGVALGIRPPPAAVSALVGIFAIFHGHAHGTEMPGNVGGVSYGLGFLVATVVLHLAGIGFGFMCARAGKYFLRAAGGFAAAIGIAFLAGAF